MAIFAYSQEKGVPMTQQQIKELLNVSDRTLRDWKKGNRAKDTTLSKEARARSAYLYSFLTDRLVELSFKTKVSVGFYHGNKNETGNGLARLYGLKNGIDMARFNQFKMTGRF